MKYTEQEINELFRTYAETHDAKVREQIIEHFLYLARAVAAKFAGRGVEFDDLYQVASLAMLKSLDRYDADSGVKFTTYVTPCMIGEIKNYFRDKSRAIHLSRRDSEQLVALSDILSRPEGGETPASIAKQMGVSVERVLELLEMRRTVNVSSLDAAADDEDGDSIGSFVGTSDGGFEGAVNRDFIERAMKKLDENERKVIYLRFWKNCSQKQTAARLNISQMTVSRLERRALAKMNSEYYRD